MVHALDIAFELDRRWHLLRGEMESSKKPDLYALAKVLAEGVAYAIIAGIALQVHQEEPRTTLDTDMVVRQRRELPRSSLTAAGFRETGRHEHSDKWVGPGQTPVQFSDDPAIVPGIARAESIPLDDVVLRVLGARDLLKAKLLAARDPARRRSKRIQDFADAQALIERDASLASDLTDAEKALIAALP